VKDASAVYEFLGMALYQDVNIAQLGLLPLLLVEPTCSVKVRLRSVHKQYLVPTGKPKEVPSTSSSSSHFLEIGVTSDVSRATEFALSLDAKNGKLGVLKAMEAASSNAGADGSTWWLEVIQEHEVGVVGRVGEPVYVGVETELDKAMNRRAGLALTWPPAKYSSSWAARPAEMNVTNPKYVSARRFGRLVLAEQPRAWETWSVEVRRRTKYSTVDSKEPWQSLEQRITEAVLRLPGIRLRVQSGSSTLARCTATQDRSETPGEKETVHLVRFHDDLNDNQDMAAVLDLDLVQYNQDDTPPHGITMVLATSDGQQQTYLTTSSLDSQPALHLTKDPFLLSGVISDDGELILLKHQEPGGSNSSGNMPMILNEKMEWVKWNGSTASRGFSLQVSVQSLSKSMEEVQKSFPFKSKLIEECANFAFEKKKAAVIEAVERAKKARKEEEEANMRKEGTVARGVRDTDSRSRFDAGAALSGLSKNLKNENAKDRSSSGPSGSSPKPKSSKETKAKMAATLGFDEPTEGEQGTSQPIVSGGIGSNAGPCKACGRALTGSYTVAMNQTFHPNCFLCCQCRRPLHPSSSGDSTFRLGSGKKPYCKSCYATHVAPRCARCQQAIMQTVITAMDRTWHEACLTCVGCGQTLTRRFYLYAHKPRDPWCTRCVDGSDLLPPDQPSPRTPSRIVTLGGQDLL